MEGDDVSAGNASAILRYPAADAPGRGAERVIAIDVRQSGDVVGARSLVDCSRDKRDREHHRFRPENASAAADEFRLPQHRMTEAEQVSDLVQCNRFDVVASGFAARGGGP